MARLRWSPQAVADLNAICEYISDDSPAYARVFAQNVVALIETIDKFPFSGRVVPEYRQPDLRERVFQNYRIIYQIQGSNVDVVVIVHAARNFKTAIRRRL